MDCMGWGWGTGRGVHMGKCCMAQPGSCIAMLQAPGMAQVGCAALHSGMWAEEQTGTGWGPVQMGMGKLAMVTGADTVTCKTTTVIIRTVMIIINHHHHHHHKQK